MRMMMMLLMMIGQVGFVTGGLRTINQVGLIPLTGQTIINNIIKTKTR
jgi:hypothetical protein